MIFMKSLFLLCIALPVLATEPQALRLDSVLLSTSFVIGQDSYNSSGAHLREFSLGLIYEANESLGVSTKFGFGDSLRNTVWFSSSSNDQMIREAYAYYKLGAGLIEMGFIPLKFGLTGQLRVEQQLMLLPLVFEQKYIGSSDVGIRMGLYGEDVQASFMLHNGESILKSKDEQNDDKYFATMNLVKLWDDQNFVGGSTQAGQYLAKNSVTAVNRKMRMLGLYGGKSMGSSQGYMEIIYGDERFEDTERKFSFGRIDLMFKLSEQWSSVLRWESFDPDREAVNDRETLSQLGLVLESIDSQSKVVFSFGQRNSESGQTDKVGQIQWNIGTNSLSLR